MADARLQGHRLFIAILPPRDEMLRIGALRDTLGDRKPVRNEHLHMTMGLLPDQKQVDETIVATAKAALAAVRSEPVRICLDRVRRNPGFSGLVPSEPAPALIELQRRISRAFANARLPFAEYWSFNPHVTLLRHASESGIEHVVPISWRAKEVALVLSLIGLTRHIVLQRVTLTPR